jgi:hypothetical protein
MAGVGLHYLKRGEYAAARPWMERSLQLGQWVQDRSHLLDAAFYLDVINRNLLEATTNRIPASLNSPRNLTRQ